MNQKNNTHITVNELYDNYSERLGLESLTDTTNYSNKITSIRVQKPGLRIIEENIKLEKGKIQILSSMGHRNLWKSQPRI